MRVKQLWHWIYHRGATEFGAMTTIGGALRGALAERHTLARPGTAVEQRSADGTRKWLLRFADGREVETVYIPEEDPRRALPLLPGRLHALLHLLPHGNPALGAQPDGGRDRRADPRGPRFLRRVAVPARAAHAVPTS